jgi:uncharacterized small protein (DUF1192 family)
VISRRIEPRLRLLLSWRKKVLQAGDHPADHSFDRRRYASFDDFRAAELEGINRRLSKLRNRGHRYIERRALALRTALQAREDLPARIQSGRLKPEAANRENRELEGRIAALRDEIARYNQMLSAESPEDLGGYIDRPLPAYAWRTGAIVRNTAQKMIPRTQNHFLVLCALAGLLVMAGIVQHNLWGGEVVFQADVIGGRDGQIRLLCHNGTLSTIQFFAPWTEGLGGEKPRRTYGVDLYVATNDEPELRRFSSEGDLWLRQGKPSIHLEAVRIDPGLIEEFFLDLYELDKRLPGYRAVQLTCSREDGETVFAFSWEAPGAAK